MLERTRATVRVKFDTFRLGVISARLARKTAKGEVITTTVGPTQKSYYLDRQPFPISDFNAAFAYGGTVTIREGDKKPKRYNLLVDVDKRRGNGRYDDADSQRGRRAVQRIANALPGATVI